MIPVSTFIYCVKEGGVRFNLVQAWVGEGPVLVSILAGDPRCNRLAVKACSPSHTRNRWLSSIWSPMWHAVYSLGGARATSLARCFSRRRKRI